jgi:hypothetical protein
MCVSGAHRALVAAEKDDTVLVANSIVCAAFHTSAHLQKNLSSVDEPHTHWRIPIRIPSKRPKSAPESKYGSDGDTGSDD